MLCIAVTDILELVCRRSEWQWRSRDKHFKTSGKNGTVLAREHLDEKLSAILDDTNEAVKFANMELFGLL